MAASHSGEQLLLESVAGGTEQHVEMALQRFASSVNKPTPTDSYPLHLAVWRNHLGIVDRLLKAGAKPDLQDGESGWTGLHRAVYFGHLAVAHKLLAAGALLDVPDHQGRTPLDIVAQELSQGGQRHVAPHVCESHVPALPLTSGSLAAATSCTLYSFGSGANYQLGTGSTDFHELPVRVEALAGQQMVALAAAKFHSAAVDAAGRLYTWGWGRGGRLGHPDPHIHSGERALIHPCIVLGLGKRKVTHIAAAKHHMVVATSSGEVFSWGSNRDGRLGYAGVDTQPTPKKVVALKSSRVVWVVAANKHSVAITSAGEVWTWGANGHGQLGYGTSDSGANPTPRLVEALKGKVIVQAGCAKRHTVVLTSDGEPLTWGYRIVTPRRVQLAGARDIARAQLGGGVGPMGSQAPASELRFHKGHHDVIRPVAVALAVGYAHTTVIAAGGAVLTWASADPLLRVHEVLGALAGKRATCLSAGKLRTAVGTAQGDVYVWEVKPAAAAAAGAAGTGTTWTGGSPVPTQQQGQGLLHTQHTGTVPVAGASPSPSPSPLQMAPYGSSHTADTWGGSSRLPGAVGIAPTRVAGLQRVAGLCVGEKHTLALVSWAQPPLPDRQGFMPVPSRAGVGGRQARSSDAHAGRPGQHHSPASSLDGWDLHGEDSDGGSAHEGDEVAAAAMLAGVTVRAGTRGAHACLVGRQRTPTAVLGLVAAPAAMQAPKTPTLGSTPTQPLSSPHDVYSPVASHQLGKAGGSTAAMPDLQTIAQRAVATQLVEPRTVLPLLEYADACGTALLRAYCIAYCLQNLDAVLVDARPAVESLPMHLVLELEQHYKAWMTSQPASAAAQGRQQQQLATRQEGTAAAPGGWSPPLGSSPCASGLLGSSVLGAEGVLGGSAGANQPAAAGGALAAGSSSWVDRWQALGSSPPAGLGAASGGYEAKGSGTQTSWRRPIRQQLQGGRRPTAAPLWLAGKTVTPKVGPGAASHAILAALDAIGHLPDGNSAAGRDPASSTATAGGINAAASSSGDAQFASQADREAEAVAEQRVRLLRNIRKKLQQAEALEERRASGAPLDAQQQSKLGQKAALEEALQALEAGASYEEVQQMLVQAQELTSRLYGMSTAPAAASAGHASSSGRQSNPAGSTSTLATAKKLPNSAVTASDKGQATSTGRPPAAGLPATTAQPHTPDDAWQRSIASLASASSAMPLSAATGPALLQPLGGASAGVPFEAFPMLGGIGGVGGMDLLQPWAQATATPIAASVGGVGQMPPQAPTPGSKQKAKDKAAMRKGGLSLFLSGVLDKPAERPVEPAVQQPQVPKGPAWGGAGAAPPQQQQQQQSGVASSSLSQDQLRQAQEASARSMSFPVAPLSSMASAVDRPLGERTKSTASRQSAAAAANAAGTLGKPLSLAEFIPTVAAKGTKKSGKAGQEEPPKAPAGPAWGAAAIKPLSGSSPPSHASLLIIQAEQEKRRKERARAHAAASVRSQGCGSTVPLPGAASKPLVAPGATRTAAASSAKASGGRTYGSSPPAGSSPPTSKWYAPEVPAHQALQAIQTEEVAIQQLQQRFGNKVTVRRAAS